MLPIKRLRGREQFAGLIILSSLLLLGLSLVGVRLMDANIMNIELVDRDLYTVITDKGTANVTPIDVIRIERTYTKAAVTGQPVELDKIYTKQGFVYVSSFDPFAKAAQQLIKSVGSNGIKVWERPGYTGVKAVQPFAYAIGTPAPVVPVLGVLVSCQSFVLTAAGLALMVLVFPISRPGSSRGQPRLAVPGEMEYCAGDEQVSVVAK